MEATPEQSAEGLAIVRVLASVLDRLVIANGPIALADPGQITKFHAMKAPGIGIQQYLERIHKYASCSNECFILALIYIDRLIQRNNFLLTELNVHRVVITAILLAAKFFDDAYYNNAYYAKVGGVLVSEMNGLEVDFLFRINFSLHVTPAIFEKYRAELQTHAAIHTLAMTSPTNSLPVMDVHTPLHVAQTQVPICIPDVVVHHSPVPVSGHEPMIDDTFEQRVVSHITPSPPAEAGRMDDHFMHVSQEQVSAQSIADSNASQHLAQIFFSSPDSCNFDPDIVLIGRSNSMPVAAKEIPGPLFYGSQSSFVVPRCAQNSYSAPPILVGPGHFTESFVLMDRHLFPLPESLAHHHHGGIPQHMGDSEIFVGPNVVDAQRLVAGRILAGVSGAGL